VKKRMGFGWSLPQWVVPAAVLAALACVAAVVAFREGCDSRIHLYFMDVPADLVEGASGQVVMARDGSVGPSEYYLTCSQPSRLIVPEVVAFEEGGLTTEFTIEAVDNDVVDGLASVVVGVEGFDVTTTIVVRDNDEEPGPEPQPGPFPAEDCVIVIEETGERTAEQAIVLTDPDVLELMDGNIFIVDKDVKNVDGQTPDWLESLLPEAVKSGLPYVYVVREGKVVAKGQLPPTADALVEFVEGSK